MFTHVPQISRAVLAGVVLSMAGFSASAEALSSDFSFLIVEQNDEGNEILVERKTVRPGEIIHYQLNHENKTDEAMSGIVIAAPVPDGVSLKIGNEATSIQAIFEVQAELDPQHEGLEWSTLPAVRKVLEADGSLREEPLPEEEVAAVRWTLSEPLKAGESAQNSYRVRVD